MPGLVHGRVLAVENESKLTLGMSTRDPEME